ncbi:MAG: hypothetical protein MUC88_18500 [Planctomycetes bacterium]|nr:hypothetical protein [Planctomycetota bacterium]
MPPVFPRHLRQSWPADLDRRRIHLARAIQHGDAPVGLELLGGHPEVRVSLAYAAIAKLRLTMPPERWLTLRWTSAGTGVDGDGLGCPW